jgi:AraC family transcriptional regulator
MAQGTDVTVAALSTSIPVRLSRNCSVRVTLTYYPPAASLPRHAHAYDALSFLLCGSLCERNGSYDCELLHPGIGFKPAGCDHENRWGPYGALVFSIAFADGMADGALPALSSGWRALRDWAMLPALIGACLMEDGETSRIEAVTDIVGLANGEDGRARGAAPLWLMRARADLFEAPGEVTVAGAAQAAGVHRVHFSRMFRRHFGIAPSVFRRHCMTAAAMRSLLREKQPLAVAAQRAGFADQSHMSRAVKAVTGCPAGRLQVGLT